MPHAHHHKDPEPWSVASFSVPPLEGQTRFHDMDLPSEIMHAVHDLEFHYCTPVQAVALPLALDGKDVAGRAQTGTGKTAAFLISIFTRFLRGTHRPRRANGTPLALIIAPTRELVIQISKDAEGLGRYVGFKTMAVYGGMDYRKQQQQLDEQQVDLVVATPGRLLDFKRKRVLHLSKVEVLIIDEADRMLDMGFIPDVRQIIHSLPPRNRRQTMLFSATLDSRVMRLASQWMVDPVTVEIEPEQVAVDTVEQIVYIVTARQKLPLLCNWIKKTRPERVLVFCNRRDQTERVARSLTQHGIHCGVLSGDVPQGKRLSILESFRSGKVPVLVATDVAGRGIHVEGISHVINYTIPHEPEDYVHRIGRTGRAGAMGTAISFACEDESFTIPDIEEFIGNTLSCTHPDDDLLAPLPRVEHREPHRRDPAGRGRQRQARPHRRPRRR